MTSSSTQYLDLGSAVSYLGDFETISHRLPMMERRNLLAGRADGKKASALGQSQGARPVLLIVYGGNAVVPF